MQIIFLLPVLPGNIFDATKIIVVIFARQRRSGQKIQMLGSHFPSAGGCDFATDPDQPADRARPFWLPSLLPDAFELRSSPGDEADPAVMPVDLAALPGLDLRSAVDGASHGLWHSGDLTHQFWLADPLPRGHGAFCVALPLDMLLELRIAALLRFWRALRHRPPGDWRQDLPPQTRSRHVLTLRALDGKLDGASYRQIAEALLGFHGRKADWETDPRKNQIRRLVADVLSCTEN